MYNIRNLYKLIFLNIKMLNYFPNSWHCYVKSLFFIRASNTRRVCSDVIFVPYGVISRVWGPRYIVMYYWIREKGFMKFYVNRKLNYSGPRASKCNKFNEAPPFSLKHIKCSYYYIRDVVTTLVSYISYNTLKLAVFP